jgi:hypothetical protein
MIVRDSQKSKVMLAEKKWRRNISGYTRLFPPDRAELYMRGKLRALDLHESLNIKIRKAARGSPSSFRLAIWINIELPNRQMSEAELMHELAHIVSHREIHNYEYCKTMLRLVREHMGTRAAGELADQYRYWRVKLHPDS